MRTKVVVAIASGATLLAVALNTQAAGGLTGTPHDFHLKTWTTNGVALNQLCLPCHTPHGAAAVELALWNHALPLSSAFTRLDMTEELGPASLACLGCHDGQTGLDSFSGRTGSQQLGDANNPLVNARALIGTDLTDDHPVGVFYSVTNGQTSTSWGTIITTLWGSHAGVSGTSGSLPLYGDGAGGKYSVECSSCHTPHSNSKGTFLRIQNNLASRPSALCVTCHLSKE